MWKDNRTGELSAIVISWRQNRVGEVSLQQVSEAAEFRIPKKNLLRKLPKSDITLAWNWF